MPSFPAIVRMQALIAGRARKNPVRSGIIDLHIPRTNRRTVPTATPGRDRRLPRAAVTDFAAFPARADTRLAGLLLTVPDLVSLDLPALISKADYSGTSVIPRSAGCYPCSPSS